MHLNGRGVSGSDVDKGPRRQTYQGLLQKEMNMRMVGGASNVARTYRAILLNEYSSSSVYEAIEKQDEEEDVLKLSSSCVTAAYYHWHSFGVTN